jgi:hypothetical protein
MHGEFTVTTRFTRVWLFVGACVCAVLTWECRKAVAVNTKDNIPISYVDADGSHESQLRDTSRNPFPHLKLTGGAISLNDKCPVRKVSLNLRLPTLFVNGQPIGFC